MPSSVVFIKSFSVILAPPSVQIHVYYN